MIAITGANGQLGRLVIAELLKKVPADSIVAAVRTPESATDLAELGVQVRKADYNQPETLADAFTGVEKVLLISSSEVGQRTAQHKAVIDAVGQADVKLLAYTSILQADKSPLMLATEHKETEALIQASGIPSVILRNGWYTENYTMALAGVLAHGAVAGCAGEGRIATASRRDYAKAAAAVLTSNDAQAGKMYELAGDTAFTLADYAEEIARQSCKPITFQNMPEGDFSKLLIEVGLPAPFAEMLANAETGASNGWLDNDGSDLANLIGQPTVTLSESVSEALQQLQ